MFKTYYIYQDLPRDKNPISKIALQRGAYTDHKFLTKTNVDELCDAQKDEEWEQYWRIRFLKAELGDSFIQSHLHSCLNNGLPDFENQLSQKFCMFVNKKSLCDNPVFLKTFEENMYCNLK